MAENLAGLQGLTAGQDIIRPFSEPVKPTGHIAILQGNLAPEFAVGKITGKEGTRFEGPAKCFDQEEDLMEAVAADHLALKGCVIVIRYEGPKGGPGMKEMLNPTSVVMGAGLGRDVALITDGRFSGGSHGFCVGHVAPSLNGALAESVRTRSSFSTAAPNRDGYERGARNLPSASRWFAEVTLKLSKFPSRPGYQAEFGGRPDLSAKLRDTRRK